MKNTFMVGEDRETVRRTVKAVEAGMGSEEAAVMDELVEEEQDGDVLYWAQRLGVRKEDL